MILHRLTLVAGLMAATAAYAHESAGQHGGRVADAGKFHVELATKGETVDVFLSDEGQKPVAPCSSPRPTVPRPAASSTEHRPLSRARPEGGLKIPRRDAGGAARGGCPCRSHRSTSCTPATGQPQ